MGALLTAAAVPVVAWLCWTLLRESPREPITMANPATGARSDEAADVPPLVAGGRAASAAQAAPDPATSAPEETRLAVTVVDDLGRPAAGAEVFVVDREAGFRFRGTTDESGVLDLTVEEGEVGAAGDPTLEDRVILAATKAGHADSFDVFVRCPLGSARSVRIELRGPELVIEGLVTDAAGRAIQGAEIQAVIGDRWQTDGDLLLKESLSWASADASGSFRMCGLVPGVQVLTVRATGWVPSMLTVEGRAGGVVECAVVLGEAGSVAGVVRDQQGNPVPGALLTHDVLDFDEINRRKENRADPDGYYQVDGLPPGRHMLWAQDPERSGLMSRDWVEVGAGTIEYWDPVLEPVNGIRVRVVDEQGIGLEGRRVEFLFQSGTEFWHREFETGPDGRAMVFDLPPDRAIQVKVRGGPERFSRAYRAGLKPAAEEILLVVSPTEPTGSVSGVLLTDQGAPPPAATAWLFSTTTSDASSVFIDRSSGEFAIERVPGGTYELLVVWDGHGQFSMGRVDLVDGEQVDRGLTRMPATGLAVIDWSWPVGGGVAGPRFSLFTKSFAGRSSLVSNGPAPPPDHLDLLPGQYALIAEQDELLQQSEFRVGSGREVRVVSGPGLQQR